MPILIKFFVNNLLKKTSWDIYLCKKQKSDLQIQNYSFY